MGLASILLLICVVLCAELLRRAWIYEHRCNVLASQADSALLRLREARLQAEKLRQLVQAQALTETMVGGGTATVRAVHKGIASIPFGILEAIPATSVSAKAARKTHDAIADTVYGAISGANRLLGEAARKKIHSPDSDDKSPSKQG